MTTAPPSPESRGHAAAASPDRAGSSHASKPAPAASGLKLNLAAAVLGWVLPGLGHLVLGQAARGLILAVTIGSVWLGGLLIGGVSVIDRREHPAWFLGQMWVAPTWLVDRYHDGLRQTWIHEAGTRPDVQRGYEPAYGKPEEQGTLYVALAGLLNLLAIIDALFREPWPMKQIAGEDVDVMRPVEVEPPDGDGSTSGTSENGQLVAGSGAASVSPGGTA